MSNLTLRRNITIALDDKGEVIWTSKRTGFGGGDFYVNCKNAVTIIVGDNVTGVNGAYASLPKIRNIFVYDQNIFDSTVSYYESQGNINTSGDSVSIKLVTTSTILNSLFNYYDKNLFINSGNILNVSDFVNNYSSSTDDTAVINNAVEFVVNNGGKLVFDTGESFVISSPIIIQPPSKDSLDTGVRDFEIDFNNCEISLNKNNNDTPFNCIYINSKNGKILDDTEQEENSIKINSMIYVNAGFPEEERIGIIKNLTLDSGYYEDSSEMVPCVETGMYLYASSHISYKNIEIRNVTRGVYLHQNPNNIEVFMDDIRVLKSHVNGVCELELTEDEAKKIQTDNYPYETKNGKEECKHVGIDCRTTDSHFSNIKVQDYLIGIRMLGGDNRVCNSHVGHKYCTTQRKYAVGYGNGSTSYYNNCEVDDFHIGWISYYAVPFFLTDCIMVGSKAILSTENKYAFYIWPENYSGGGIYSGNCNIVSSAFDVNDDSLLFSNIRKKHPEDNNREVDASDIHTDLDKNNLRIDISNMHEYDSSAAHTCAFENNSTFNQYGKIKTISKEISNSTNEKFNIYDLKISDFPFGDSERLTYEDAMYMDNKENALGSKGTISCPDYAATTVSKENNELQISILPYSSDYSGMCMMEIDLKDLGYEPNDVGCISFNYYTEEEVSQQTQSKDVIISSITQVVDYFTGEGIEAVPLEQGNEWKSFCHMFKIKDYNEGYYYPVTIRIGHGSRETDDDSYTLDRNLKPIKIKNLRIIKFPSDLKFPKYYLETEENYKKRLLNTFANRKYNFSVDESTKYESITFPKYDDARTLYDGCSDSTLTFVSLPYKHTVSDNTEDSKTGGYKLNYSTSGSTSFKGLLRDTFDGKINPEIYVKYNSNGKKNYFVVANCEDPLYDNNALDKSKFVVEKLKIEDNGNLVDNYIGEVCNGAMDKVHLSLYDDALYREFELTEDDSELTNIIILPLFKISKANENVTDAVPEDIVEVSYDLSYFSVNPYGYYTEPLVDEDVNAEDGVDIPLYADGEVRLMVKDMQYSTDLPTVFYEVKYEELQDVATEE